MATDTATQTRCCIGSSRFGIEAHDADAGDFPVQASQKDGFGRMCKPHWRVYTNALRKAAVARKAETTEALAPGPDPEAEVQETAEPETTEPDLVNEPEAPAPRRRRAKAAADPDGAEADAA